MSLTGNAIVELRPDRWAAGGDAIARAADGRVVFVAGAIPGEIVRAEITASKKDFLRASVVEVLDASPDRLEPACPMVAAGCGGCSWQHVDHQLAHKTDIVRDALRRTARMPDAVVSATGSVDPFGYRTTLRLAADHGRIGLRAAASHRVVPVAHCPVAHQQVNDVLPSLRTQTGEVTVRVSLATGAHTVLETVDGAKGQRRERGASSSLVETVAGVPLRVSAPSFFQSGVQAAELLVGTVRSALGDRLTDSTATLDAYGGIGLFSATLPLLNPIIVEGSASACADARVNLPRAVVAESNVERWAPVPVGTAVVDPARSGLGREAAGVLAATGAELVVLVSCDPVAMARDVALLTEHGYRHRATEVLDLFPQTPHVEAVTVLER